MTVTVQLQPEVDGTRAEEDGVSVLFVTSLVLIVLVTKVSPGDEALAAGVLELLEEDAGPVDLEIGVPIEAVTGSLTVAIVPLHTVVNVVYCAAS